MRNYNMPNYGMMPSPGMRERMERPKCDTEDSCLEMNYAVAMAYVPWQKFGTLHEPEKALNVGTIFEDLNKPFLGKRVMMR